MTTIEKSMLDIIEKQNRNGKQPPKKGELLQLRPLTKDEMKVIKGGKYNDMKSQDEENT